MKKILSYVMIVIICVTSSADIIFPPSVYSPDEITWFGSTGRYLVACWRDSTVGIWDCNTTKFVNSFKQEHYTNPELMFFILSSGDEKLFSVVPENNSRRWIRLYNIENSKNSKLVNLPEGGINAIWFSETGNSLLCASYSYGMNFCEIDINSNKILWQSTLKKDKNFPMQSITYPCLQRSIYFDRYDVVAKENNGTIIWKKEYDIKDLIGIYPFDVQPVKAKIILVNKVSERGKSTISAINAVDGNTIWEKVSPWEKEYPVDSLKLITTSPDGKKQVWYDKNGLSITLLPDDKVVKIPEIKEPVEAIFTTEGSLLCLPELKIISKNRESYTNTRARKSHLLKVVDTSTGKIIKQIELKKPGISKDNKKADKADN